MSGAGGTAETCSPPEFDWATANKQVAARGKAILEAYVAFTSHDPNNTLCNLIAHLMHACERDAEFGDFDEGIRLGDMHYEMDLDEAQGT